MKILLIEDDLDLGNGVRIALADQGFDVIWVRRKEDALHQLGICVPELILLDLGLPDGDGMSLMTRLRQQLKGVPVIILTARGTLQDRLCGLDAGADDYLVKPFVLAELLARVRALARRSYGFENEAIEIRGLSLHIPTRRVTVSARHVELTASEYALLETLMLRAIACLRDGIWKKGYLARKKTSATHLMCIWVTCGEKLAMALCER